MNVINLIDKSQQKTVESIKNRVIHVKKHAEIILKHIEEGRYSGADCIQELKKDTNGMMDEQTQYLFAVDGIAFFFEEIANTLRETQDLSFENLACLMWAINQELGYVARFIEELDECYND